MLGSSSWRISRCPAIGSELTEPWTELGWAWGVGKLSDFKTDAKINWSADLLSHAAPV